MASGFFALLDDIALLMDDVATLGKVATKKTAGILGDDLAVNAEKATGFAASRELPVLWAITKGSLVNKLVLVPVVLGLSAWIPWFVEPVLVAGGVFLAYEGAEKVVHWAQTLFRRPPFHAPPSAKAPVSPTESSERDRVRSAIVVDFILSLEIVILALSSVVEADLAVRVVVVSGVALLATVGVYGLVALIVRMDDAGLALMRTGRPGIVHLGRGLVVALPWVIKSLSLAGTVALLLVSGGIFRHHVPYAGDLAHGPASFLPEAWVDMMMGLIAGAIAWACVQTLRSFQK